MAFSYPKSNKCTQSYQELMPKEYKKKIRQEMYYVGKFGLDEHLKRIGDIDKQKYLLSLKGRIAFVLQTTPKDKEFLEYKSLIAKEK